MNAAGALDEQADAVGHRQHAEGKTKDDRMPLVARQHQRKQSEQRVAMLFHRQ